jgi:Pentapeptide repeats (8 copies)
MLGPRFANLAGTVPVGGFNSRKDAALQWRQMGAFPVRYGREIRKQTGIRLAAKPLATRKRLWIAGGAIVLLAVSMAVYARSLLRLVNTLVLKIRAWQQNPSPVRLFIVIAALILVAILTLWLLPRWHVARSSGVSSNNRFDRENEARKTLAQIIGGVLLLAGLYSSVQTFDLQRQTFDSQKDAQITDRYTKAVDQLGSMESGKPNLAVRLGGIYALERISRDSPKDRATIMEVLSAYVRQNAPGPRREKHLPDSETLYEYLSKREPPHEDIQAILKVIGRREARSGFPIDAVDLSMTNLQMADLEDAQLELADLFGAQLQGAQLERADLERADLERAHLEGAILSGVHLEGAILSGVHVRPSFGGELDIEGADLEGAELREAHLEGTDLHGVIGLTQEQLNSAIGDDKTILPEGLKRPDIWKKPHP